MRDIHDHGERVLVLGDAMYCPQQLTELEWGAVSDVDPALARKTRERYERDLELHGGGAVGCHFPELRKNWSVLTAVPLANAIGSTDFRSTLESRPRQ